jgi:hypothetical protein
MGFAELAARSVLVMLLSGVAVAHAADEATASSAPAPIDASTSRPGDASIPFADHGGINDWRADKTRGIWVQSTNHKWFYGTFMTPCTGLDQSEAVGFVTSPSGDLDHWSYIVIRGTVPCHFASFTASEAPPTRE